MATVVRMPSVMAGATEAALQSWLVAEGDAVAQGQSIAEIETEKAVFEHESEASGVVARLLVQPGVAVAVGAPIAILANEGESAEEAVAAAGIADPRLPAPAGSTAHADDASARTADAADGPEPRAEAQTTRLFASPLVRRLAKERGVDLAAIDGSGPNGRIVRRDLDELAASTGFGDSSQIRTEAVASSESGAELRVQDAGKRQDAGDEEGFTDVPHTRMRLAIARRLTESVTTVPQFSLTADCRVDELVALREKINTQTDHHVSLNDLVVKAVAWALTDVPEANAIWTDGAVRRFAHADIGIAVSVPDGLVTPVVRAVDTLSLGEVSAGIRDLAERARERRLTQGEVEGGSFAVSNLGMHGTKEFTAIINPPHSGILAVGAATRRPVVADDGELAVGTVMTVTLTADHRVLDGALAARWLAAFVSRIENPIGILL
jgi:pyruvate dehydrogenase E2 component (dihydrolipoamide acetyltransferase)